MMLDFDTTSAYALASTSTVETPDGRMDIGILPIVPNCCTTGNNSICDIIDIANPQIAKTVMVLLAYMMFAI